MCIAMYEDSRGAIDIGVSMIFVIGFNIDSIFSSPDHEVVMVRYSDGAMSVVVRRQQLGC
jgi:hypothetical protein